MNGNSQHSKQLEEERREGNVQGTCAEGREMGRILGDRGVETSCEWTEGRKIDRPARSNANIVKSC